MYSVIVGLYDDHDVAEQVYRELEESGIDEEDLHMVSHRNTDLSNWKAESSYWDNGCFGHDIVDRLVALSFSRQDAELYCEGVRRGATLVVVRADEAHEERAVDIINLHRPVDIRARHANWRSRGFRGYDRRATPFTEEQVREEREYISREAASLSPGHG